MRKISETNMGVIAPSKENICAVVVTYFPDAEFGERVMRVVQQTATVVIVDNGSSGQLKQMLKGLREKRIILIENETNRGVAVALNIGMAWARKHAFAWCLTFDQDTIPDMDMVSQMGRSFFALKDPERAAVLAPCYREPSEDQADPLSGAFEEKKVLITSGSLCSVALCAEIGPFREAFFIDLVDFEYCLRARRKGFKVCQLQKCLMTHFVGRITRHWVLGRKISVYNHPPFRWYFICRNHWILITEYLPHDARWSLLGMRNLLQMLLAMTVFEKQRLRRWRFVWLGLWDGIRRDTSRNETVIAHAHT